MSLAPKGPAHARGNRCDLLRESSPRRDAFWAMFRRCKKVLVLRNQLTHHFFWDFAEQWFSPQRRPRSYSIDELPSRSKTIGQTARLVQPTFVRRLVPLRTTYSLLEIGILGPIPVPAR